MYKSVIGALGALAVLITPVAASAADHEDYNGAYVGLEAGIGFLKGSALGISQTDNSALIGAVLGYRGTLGEDGPLVLGIEGTVDFVTDESDWRYGAYAIAGIRMGERGLAYLRAGYGQLNSDGQNVEGPVFGGGFEFGLSERTSMRIDYRYLKYGTIIELDIPIKLKSHEIMAAFVLSF